jgi:N-acetylmuramoyl-L-alanine amidase
MRKIDTIIIHCSATPEGRNVTTEEIRGWHKAKGWRDIGYHFVITLDGLIHKGRPVKEKGAHAGGYNSSSIGICYVGGCDQNMRAKDTLNALQRDSIQALIIELSGDYPITKLMGHNEVSSKACPSFKVSEKFTL